MGTFDWINAQLWPNAFNPPAEKGVDLREPFHTPITAPWSGTVTNVLTGRPWGAEVDLSLNSTVGGATQYSVVHLDQIAQNITPGAHVMSGQLLGFSGGQNSGGSNPASPLYSSGPHVEVDLWKGTPWGNTPSINPLPYLQQVMAGGGPSDTGSSSGGGIPNPLDVSSNFFNFILSHLGLPSLKDLFFRSGFIIVGALLLIAGLVALILGGHGPDSGAIVERGGSAAKTSAEVA